MAGGRDIRLRVLADADARELDTAARGFERLADKIDHTGDEARETTREVGHLDRELAKAAATVELLGKQFDATGNKTLLRDLGKARRELSQLNALRKEMDGGGGGSDRTTREVSEAGRSIAESFGRAMPLVSNPSIAGGIAAAIIAGSPVIGGAMAAAITLGLGGGVLAGGIALAARDERVKTAFSQVGESILGSLTADAEQAFSGPLIRAADKVRTTYSEVRSEISGAFMDLGNVVDPLVDGIAGFVREAMPGIREAIHNSLPLFNMLAAALPALGREVGDFFERVSRSKGAIEGLHIAINVLSASIHGTGVVIEFLANTLDFMIEKGNRFLHFMAAAANAAHLPFADQLQKIVNAEDRWIAANDDATKSTHTLDDGTNNLTGSLAGLGNQMATTTNATDAAAEAMTTAFDSQMELDRATAGLQRSYDVLKTSVEQNGSSLDTYTQKGLANRDALRAQIDTARAHYDALVRSGMGADLATIALGRDIEALRNNAYAAGMNRDQVNALVDQYIRLLNLPDVYKRVYVTYSVDYQNYRAGERESNYDFPVNSRARASGGSVRRGLAYWVGENGRELMVADHDGYVMPNNRLTTSPQAATGGGPGAAATVDFTGLPAGGLDAMFASWLMGAIRTKKIIIRTA